MLPHVADPEKKLIYFPYWRYRGARFSCIQNDIHHQHIDVTHQAIDSPNFPVTMGLRAQAMRLSFIPSQTPGRFLKPTLSVHDMLKRLNHRFQTEIVARNIFHQTHIGEVISLIYAPFYIGSQVMDGILNRPVSGSITNTCFSTLQEADPLERRLRLYSAICPNCGWNLSGKRNSSVLSCSNCNSAWHLLNDRFKQIPVCFLPDEHANLFLPYWRITADVSGVSLSSYADLVHLANLPKVVVDEWKQIPFYFWSLGFRLSPKTFLSQSIQLNLTQPQEKPLLGNPQGILYPTTLPITEAIDTLKISLAGMMKPSEIRFPQLPLIHIKPLRFSLVYIPFRSSHHEWIQPTYGITIYKNMLSLTDN